MLLFTRSWSGHTQPIIHDNSFALMLHFPGAHAYLSSYRTSHLPLHLHPEVRAPYRPLHASSSSHTVNPQWYQTVCYIITSLSTQIEEIYFLFPLPLTLTLRLSINLSLEHEAKRRHGIRLLDEQAMLLRAFNLIYMIYYDILTWGTEQLAQGLGVFDNSHSFSRIMQKLQNNIKWSVKY